LGRFGKKLSRVCFGFLVEEGGRWCLAGVEDLFLAGVDFWGVVVLPLRFAMVEFGEVVEEELMRRMECLSRDS